MKRERTFFRSPFLPVCIPAALIAAAFIAAVSTVGCSRGAESSAAGTKPGPSPALPAHIERIISAAPSNTEIIMALGMGDKVIAIDSYSSDLKGINPDLVQIDFSFPDAEALIGLNPDIIFSAEHNRTISGEDPFVLFKDMNVPVISISTGKTVEEIYENIRLIAGIIGREQRAEELIESMKNDLDRIIETGASIQNKKTVYFEISPYPYMITFGKGTFLHEMINLIGAENIFANEKEWFSASAEAIIGKDPDVILTLSDLNNNPAGEILRRPGFENINAVKNGQVYLIDNNAASRPSHNIVFAVKQMALAVYPELYEK
jgi:iron complex transport system substrate-binding protein